MEEEYADQSKAQLIGKEETTVFEKRGECRQIAEK
jgi:hypothetical protein